MADFIEMNERSEPTVSEKTDSALQADVSPNLPTSNDDEGRIDQFLQAMRQPSEQELKFFEDRRRRGLGVGMSDDGELIYQTYERVR